MWSRARGDRFLGTSERARVQGSHCVYIVLPLSLSLSVSSTAWLLHTPSTLFCLPLKRGLFHLSSMDFHWPVFLSVFITPLIALLWHPPNRHPPTPNSIWVTFALLCQSSCRSHSSLQPWEYESLRLEWKIRQRIIYLCCKLTRFNEQLIKINQ